VDLVHGHELTDTGAPRERFAAATERTPVRAPGRAAAGHVLSRDHDGQGPPQGSREEWRKIELSRAAQKSALRRGEFHTDSGIPIPDVLTPADMGDPSDADVARYERELGFPDSSLPRGPQPSMYRGRL